MSAKIFCFASGRRAVETRDQSCDSTTFATYGRVSSREHDGSARFRVYTPAALTVADLLPSRARDATKNAAIFDFSTAFSRAFGCNRCNASRRQPVCAKRKVASASQRSNFVDTAAKTLLWRQRSRSNRGCESRNYRGKSHWHRRALQFVKGEQ